MSRFSLSSATRIEHWWKPKASNLLAVSYTVMCLTGFSWQNAIFYFFLSCTTIAGIGGFGHIINDWFDIEADRKAGKTNKWAKLSVLKKILLVSAVLVAALFPWIWLPADQWSVIMLVAEFFLLAAYAIPPVRLKNNAWLSPVIDGLYAYALPAVIAAYTFFLATNFFIPRLLLCLLFCWQLMLGIRHFFNHIVEDQQNDIQSGTNTLAVLRGNRFVHSLGRRLVLPLEILFFCFFCLQLSRYNMALSIMVITSWLLFSSLHGILTIGRSYQWFVYRFSGMNIDWFYQNILPWVPLVLLIWTQWQFALIGVVHGLLFNQQIIGKIKHELNYHIPQLPGITSGILRKLSGIGYYSHSFATRLVSPTNGTTIKLPEDPPVPEHSPAPKKVAVETLATKTPHKINIVVANINKAKYSETFIGESLPLMNFNVLYIYGGELPEYDHEDRHFLSNWEPIRKWADFSGSALGLGRDHHLTNSISAYLQTHKTALILAQFGPTGAKLMPVARNLGIPLIVCFHGYDVFHREIVNRLQQEYQLLFHHAAAIIGVSSIMLNRLAELGAPPEKLVHLPAYVNTGLFPYSDHSSRPPHFLATGRFAETKSPHLTILAFEKVVKIIPEAKLTMIGRGGGGELFEACLILAKALKLDRHITFKGVLSHAEVALEMQKARVFVQHSVTTPENDDMEGKPVAIMEAMACGLPVVSTLHSGITELIQHGKNGLLSEEYDIYTMAENMIRLCRDDQMVYNLGISAHKSIIENPLIMEHHHILEQIIHQAI